MVRSSTTRALGQLVGQLAHDLNNLLAVTLGSVELAARAEDPARVRALLSGAVDAIHQQRAMTDAMTRSARACECNRAVDAHALIADSRNDIEAELGDVRLELHLDAAQAVICCDPAFLRDALLHLAEFGRSGNGGVLSISTANARDAHDRLQVRLAFASDGSGMGDGAPGRVFDPFFANPADPLGLGLAQARDTAVRVGGAATFENRPGQGTRVVLVFPAGDCPPPQ